MGTKTFVTECLCCSIDIVKGFINRIFLSEWWFSLARHCALWVNRIQLKSIPATYKQCGLHYEYDLFVDEHSSVFSKLLIKAPLLGRAHGYLSMFPAEFSVWSLEVRLIPKFKAPNLEGETLSSVQMQKSPCPVKLYTYTFYGVSLSFPTSTHILLPG